MTGAGQPYLEFIGETLGIEPSKLQLDVPLRNLGEVDSLALYLLVIEAEDCRGSTMPDALLASIRTIRDLLAYATGSS